MALGPSGPSYVANRASWRATLVAMRHLLGPELEVHGEEGLEVDGLGGDAEAPEGSVQ